MIYNLLNEPWVPVLWLDSKVSRVGILEALTHAARIRQIAASNPMDRVAVLRFLLALLYWCKGNPPQNTVVASEDSFPLDWFSKLDSNRECFSLLGEDKRFYQSRNENDKPLTVNYLVHEIPAGTNFWHFRHATDKKDGLCPACCALGLIRLPMFSTQGGQGKSPGINAKPPIYVVPVGETLAETLRLSWRQVSNLGTPAWENPDVQLPKTGEVPLLTGLTWLPRRVWLEEPQKSITSCILCGRREHVILSSVFAGKGSAKTDDGTRRVWHDPHVIYEQGKKGEISFHWADAVGADDAAAAQWARITAGILRNLRNDRTKVWVVGFSTDQNKYFEASELFLSRPDLQPDQTELCIEMLNQWQKSSSTLNRGLKSSNERESSLKHPEIHSMLATIRPHVEGKVSAKAEELLSGGNTAWEHAAGEYRPMMQMIARSLAPGVTTAAVERRRKIAGMLPQIGQTPTAAKKPARGKRGSK